MTGIPSSTANDIFRHTAKNAAEKRKEREQEIGDNLAAELDDSGGEEIPLLELIAKDCLDPKSRSGRPRKLSATEKQRLAATVRRGYTRRMKLVDLRREAGLGDVSDTTVLRALHEQGIKAYREEFKFILDEKNMQTRKVSHQVNSFTTRLICNV